MHISSPLGAWVRNKVRNQAQSLQSCKLCWASHAYCRDGDSGSGTRRAAPMDQKVRQQCYAIERIRAALETCGYTSLDAQARVLDLPRSTVWTIIAGKHKSGRLSKKVTSRMLRSRELPAGVREEIEAYLGTQQHEAPKSECNVPATLVVLKTSPLKRQPGNKRGPA